MAAVSCPNGHASTTTDYCDQCGAKIESSGTAAAGTAEPASASAGAPEVAAGTLLCPNCQSGRGPDEKFCEVCGYDFVTGTLPAAPAPAPASPLSSAGAASAAAPGPPWQAVVTADRGYYDRTEPDGITFPDHCPERVFALSQDEILIGRRSEGRGIHPQVDLSGAPEDTGISRSHAILRRQADGSFVVVDPGSTNGTLLNDDTTPLPHNVGMPIKDGDRLYLGAWTKIVFHAPST
ncbi:MAG TPA: FHA domain-containing protein [Acidimicrobiales bacterium]|nr:FHA domain-containing protein [Acidimicrobiales bacterium]